MRSRKRGPLVGFAATASFEIGVEGLALADVHRGAAAQVGRAYLESLHREHGDNLSAIARAAKATRTQVRTYLRRYGIGQWGKAKT
jgi:hypothetical protein